MSDVPAPNGAAPAVKSLVTKLAEVMAAVERVPKRGHNDFHGYDYATEADIADEIRKELAARNVMLLPAITGHERERVGEKGQVLTTLKMEFTFVDGDTGEERTRPWMGAGTDKEDKGLFKAMTGGEKYFLLKSFLIPTGDDPERTDKGGEADLPGRTQHTTTGRDSTPAGVVTPAAPAAPILKPLPSTAEALAYFGGGGRVCPECGKEKIRKGNRTYGGGWYCAKKDGGCGSNFRAADPPAEPAPASGGDTEDRPFLIGAVNRHLAKFTPNERMKLLGMIGGRNIENEDVPIGDLAELYRNLADPAWVGAWRGEQTK